MLSSQELRRHPCFAGADRDIRAVLEMASDMVRLEDGALLYAVGEPADALFIICSGRIELTCRLSTGNRAVVDTLVEGDLVGVSAIVPRGYRRFSARARGRCELIAIDGRLLRSACDDNPWLGRSLLMSVVDSMDRRTAAQVKLAETQH
jgi:CRP-like cAMP-binding protein